MKLVIAAIVLGVIALVSKAYHKDKDNDNDIPPGMAY